MVVGAAVYRPAKGMGLFCGLKDLGRNTQVFGHVIKNAGVLAKKLMIG